MMLLGLDLNATRVRAVSGPAGGFPYPLPLDPPSSDLPLVIKPGGARPQIGSAARRFVRQQPYGVYHNFLVHLGEPPSRDRKWFKLGPAEALSVVFQRLRPLSDLCEGVVLALPAYLTRAQADLVLDLGRKARLPLLGSLSSGLAGALVSHAHGAWFGAALVADIDEHAFALTALSANEGQIQILDSGVLPNLGLRVWQETLLNGLSDCCIMQSRRDPRASPEAEQSLFEQLDNVLDGCAQGRPIQLVLQAAHWYQNLLVSADQSTSFCASLARHCAREVEARLAMPWPEDPPSVIILTADVARLPGLVPVLRTLVTDWAPPLLRATPDPEDFGEALFRQEESQSSISLLVLSSDAPARGAHLLSGLFKNGALPPGHVELGVPHLPSDPGAFPANDREAS
jgi:hypothetical protein